MFKHSMEIVHNPDNGYLIGCFVTRTFSSERYLAMAKDSHLRNYLEVPSLSSDQVFLSIQSNAFSKCSGWAFKIFCF